MEILIIVLVYAGFLYATFKLAQSKNREPAGWMLAGLILSPILVLIILAIMQKLPGKNTRSGKKRKASKRR
ncbi:hypothetical protein N9V64_00160 [Candidatus Pelagibacter bacterium]|jgi:hypothetical protein|nr:hypothetical protein [Candidatus Pelagibacter bacterium]